MCKISNVFKLGVSYLGKVSGDSFEIVLVLIFEWAKNKQLYTTLHK